MASITSCDRDISNTKSQKELEKVEVPVSDDQHMSGMLKSPTSMTFNKGKTAIDYDSRPQS